MKLELILTAKLLDVINLRRYLIEDLSCYGLGDGRVTKNTTCMNNNLILEILSFPPIYGSENSVGKEVFINYFWGKWHYSFPVQAGFDIDGYTPGFDINPSSDIQATFKIVKNKAKDSSYATHKVINSVGIEYNGDYICEEDDGEERKKYKMTVEYHRKNIDVKKFILDYFDGVIEDKKPKEIQFFLY